MIKYLLILFLLLIPTAQAGFSERSSHAFDFESGSSQSLTSADNADLDLGANLTLELWAKFESIPSAAGGSDQTLIAKYNAGANQRAYRWTYNGDGTNIEFQWGTSTDGAGAGSVATLECASGLSVGIWNHLAVVNRSAGTADIYLNGQPITCTGTVNTVIFNSTATFGIGDSAGFGFADGIFDEVRVWNISRTRAEIQDNMRREIPPSTRGLVGYWRFDGDSPLSEEPGVGPNVNNLTNNNGTFHTADSVPLINRSNREME